MFGRGLARTGAWGKKEEKVGVFGLAADGLYEGFLRLRQKQHLDLELLPEQEEQEEQKSSIRLRLGEAQRSE